MFRRKSLIRADRIKMWREERGLTHQHLADLMHISAQDIEAHERGYGSSNPEIVQRFAKALQVTTSYLLGLVDDPGKEITMNDLSEDERLLMSALMGDDQD